MSSMSQEILAFILTISGWVLVSSTLPTDYWQVSSNDGSVITTSTFWSNLWKVCVTDSTGVSSCRDFPSMLALDGYIQACRGLMIAAVCLGFFGSIFALIGMKCTKVGGTDKNKAKIACLSGVNFILCDQKYELGAALFIGWGGSILCILGGSVFCFSIADSFSKSHSQENYIYKGAARQSHISSYPRGQAVSVNQRPPPANSNSSRVQHFDKNVYV
ncbi:claudin-10-like isoform X2 [Anabas testudineus]|uniref:claudin-10-like isoform X2 n=1 Tax=Anabas testudineus TaxID=64144 RepID=UPI000E4623C3|nr:claudin-10-like isoform X2 [Anabas testudineus]